MAYKYSGISEYAAYTKCIYIGILFIFTQLCKMLFLATFFPDTETNALTAHLNLLDTLKSTVDFADFVGIHVALNSVPGKGHAKILTTALGWACAEVLLTRSILLWVGARGSEFDWMYIRSCGECNVILVQHAATAALVWLWARSDLPRRHVPLVAALLALTPYKFIIEETVRRLLSLGPWAMLLLRAVHTLATAFTALGMYAVIVQ